MSRSIRTIWLALAALFAALAIPAAAQDFTFPETPEGPIYDGADLLSASTEAALDQRLRDYNRETGNAIIVATIPSLEGTAGQNVSIERYSTELFAEWGIGGAQRDTGLLLLISEQDRQMRIEIGYGLHPYFGGIMASRVINEVITPSFKAGDFDGGVTSGVDAILSHLANSPEDAIAIEEAAQAAAENQRSEGGFPIGTLIWLGFLFFFFILPMLSGRKGRKRYRRAGVAGAVGDIILWEAGKAIARGIDGGGGGGWGGGGGFGGGGGGGFGGFGGGMSGGGGASGGW